MAGSRWGRRVLRVNPPDSKRASSSLKCAFWKDAGRVAALHRNVLPKARAQGRSWVLGKPMTLQRFRRPCWDASFDISTIALANPVTRLVKLASITGY